MTDIIQNNEPESNFNTVIVQANSSDNSFLLTNSERVPLNSLKRVLSKDSMELYDNLFSKEMCKMSDSQIDVESPRSIISALFAIKFAHRSERITDIEKKELKENLRNKSAICDSVLSKLNETESFAIKHAVLSYKPIVETSSVSKFCCTLSDSIFTCQICCDEYDVAEKGIMCSKGKEHFICNECVTDFVKMRNKDPRTSQFMDRKGSIYCPALLDKSNTICNACYPIGEVCRHLLDSQVIEDFIEGLQYFQKAVMVANYTEQLFKNLEEVKNAHGAASVEFDRQQKLLQLQEMANVIMRTCDARQCPACGWGPILLDGNCDSLTDHHRQELSDGGVYDNSCRQCGLVTPNKSDLPPWDGTLPASITEHLKCSDEEEAIVVKASEDAVSFNRLAEVMKLIDINFADLSDARFRCRLQNIMNQQKGLEQEMLERIRAVLEDSRRMRQLLKPPENDIRVVNGTWDNSFLLGEAAAAGLNCNRPFTAVCKNYVPSTQRGCRNGNRCLFIHPQES